VPELDLGALSDRLGAAGVVDVRPLRGGASSLTYIARIGDRPVVVKVAPPGVRPVLNRDVLRQARLLHALRATAVPVPEVLHEDAGAPPAVPPLFVMSFIGGESCEPLFDLGEPSVEAGVMAERMRAAARTMAVLHRVDPRSVGLTEEPRSGPAEEVERWRRPLETVDPALVPGWDGVRDALRSSVPTPDPEAAVVVHGDFRLGNLLAAGDRITGVVDWEIWSLGDLRVDAGWFLLNADPETYRRATPYAGLLPPPGELAAVYAEQLGRPLADVAWFEALACFKSVATWSLIVKHNRRRAAPDAGLEAMVPVLPRLLARARDLLD
jgi:aminoglycoside phosphotransferase (APT) family kinase protein